MAKISGNEIRPGYVIEHHGGLWVAVRTNTVKPGKGGAYNQVELKNLLNGTKLNERFRSDEKVEQTRLDLKDFSFLYEQGDQRWSSWTPRATSSSNCRRISSATARAFLQDGMMVTVQLYNETPIGVSLPDQVTLAITEADPVVKGQTAASSYKPAMLENGIRVLVPPFISVRRAHHRRHQRTHLRPPRRTGSGTATRADGALSSPQRHGPGRHEGRPLARRAISARCRTCRSSLKGPGDYVSQADRKAEEIILTELAARPSGLRLPDGGARRGRRRRRPASLDRRPARRHHQLPARHPDLLGLHRAGAAGPARRRRRLQPGDGRALHRRARRRRLPQ